MEKEATRTLKTYLGSRRIVDVVGPEGWTVSAISSGRTEGPMKLADIAVEGRLRRVQPLIELRAPFTLRRSELDVVDRGAPDPDLDPLIAAARHLARSENRAVFHGLGEAGIRGLCETAEGADLPLPDDYAAYPIAIATAVGRLHHDGVDGPYAVALSERCYTGLTETTSGGYPVLEHVRRIVDGPLVWVPGLEGAAVVSLRGGDFELTIGRDIEIGYLDHDTGEVRLYFEESLAFRVLSRQAAVPLPHRSAPAERGAPPTRGAAPGKP